MADSSRIVGHATIIPIAPNSARIVNTAIVNSGGRTVGSPGLLRTAISMKGGSGTVILGWPSTRSDTVISWPRLNKSGPTVRTLSSTSRRGWRSPCGECTALRIFTIGAPTSMHRGRFWSKASVGMSRRPRLTRRSSINWALRKIRPSTRTSTKSRGRSMCPVRSGTLAFTWKASSWRGLAARKAAHTPVMPTMIPAMPRNVSDIQNGEAAGKCICGRPSSDADTYGH